MSRRIFGYGAYSLLHSLGNKVVFSSDAIVVGIVLSVQAVTPYSIAGSLVQYLRALLASHGQSIHPGRQRSAFARPVVRGQPPVG